MDRDRFWLIGERSFSVLWKGAKRVFGLLWLRPKSTWASVARELNLGLWDVSGEPLELAGPIGGFDVRVTQRPNGMTTDFRVESREIPRDLFLRGEGYLGVVYHAQEIELKDEAFDKVVLVQGDEPTVFALLNEQNRARLLEFIGQSGGVIEGSTARLSVIGGVCDAVKLKATIQELLEVARRLCLPRSEIPHRLADNAASRDLLSIRLRNLELLQRHFGTLEVARQASLEALKDRRSEMRLQAAMFLREIDLLVKMAAIELEPLGTRIRAIRFLVERAPPSKVLPLLEELLDALAPAVRIEAVTGLGELRHRPALAKVCRLAEGRDLETALAAVSTLAKMGDSAAEPTLLGLLERGDNKLKMAVARALGGVGTAAAVEPLLSLTGGVLESELGRTARESVARIQSRLGDVEAGRLTLAELTDREGALSLSREGGELSLHKQKRVIPPDAPANRKIVE